MTQVTITKAVGGHQTGDTLDTSPGAAAYLIEAGYADLIEDTKPTGRAKKTKTDEGVGDTPSDESSDTAG